MNELTELDNAGSPEPGLRLRKGHMPSTATQSDIEEDSSEQRFLLVEPPLSSDQENEEESVMACGVEEASLQMDCAVFLVWSREF